jgi:hypothetical protein
MLNTVFYTRVINKKLYLCLYIVDNELLNWIFNKNIILSEEKFTVKHLEK